MAKRNSAIDIFRYICAAMVVAIHTEPFYDINVHIGYFLQIITRIAVPFFFITSGYYYIRKSDSGTRILKPFLLRILKTYALWSCLYFMVDFFRWGYMNIKGFLAHCVYSFFLTGSHYHFWFFPALTYSACFVALFYKLKLQKALLPVSFLLYTIGCLGCSYRTIGNTVPGLSALFELSSFLTIRRIFLMGFPFFVAGIAVDRICKYIEQRKMKNSTQALALGSLAAIWFAEIVAITYLKWMDNIVVSFGLYMITIGVLVFFLLHPPLKLEKVAVKCHKAADFTYCVHPLIISLLQAAAAPLNRKIANTVLFFLTVFAAGMLLSIWHWLQGRVIPLIRFKKKIPGG